MSLASPRPGGSKRLLFPLISLSIGTLFALALGEGAFRILGLRGTEFGRIFRISNGADLQFPGRAGHTVIDLYPSNPRHSFPVDLRDEETRRRLIREKFTRVEEARAINPYGVLFSYNSRGFRDREFVPKPGGTRRIVFVGDSFTEAQGVVEESTAARQVEGLLRRRDASIEAWNLGVRGYDFPDLETIFDSALDLSPDLVIYLMVLNDADRDPALTRNWPRVNDWIMVRQQTPSWLERHSYAFSFLAERYETMEVSRDTTAWYQALYSDDNKDGWMRTRASWLRIQTKCRDRGASFGVALWPLLVGLEPGWAYPFQAAHDQIKKGVERASIPFLDLLPVLQARDSASLWVHPSDLHPNEKAQSLVAPELAEFAHGLLERGTATRSVAK